MVRGGAARSGRGEAKRARRSPTQDNSREESTGQPPEGVVRPVVELVAPAATPEVMPTAPRNEGERIRGRLARFAAVAEAPSPSRLGLAAPASPRPLGPLDRLRLVLTDRRADPTMRSPARRRQTALTGLLTGLVTGLLAGLVAYFWYERDVMVGLALTLLTTGSSLVVWWLARSTTAGAVHLAALLLVLWLTTPAGRILYESDRDTGFRTQIYLTTANGGSTDRLTSSPTMEIEARPAPDGRRVALAHYQEGNIDIFVTEADGAFPRNLTRHPAEDRAPAWSPDGGEIAFQSNRSGNWDIYIIQADGLRLRKATSSPADDQAPTWSPTGRTLAFQSDRTSFTQIYTLGVRGAVVPLTSGLHDNRRPAWSPDGAQIAFESNRDGRWQVYVMRADGSAVRRLVSSSSNDMMPAWSAGGRSVVFTSDRDGNLELYSVHVDGSGLRRLTDTPTHEQRPIWLGISSTDWPAVGRYLGAWLGLLAPAWPSGETVVSIAPPAPREEAPSGGRPLAPGEDVLPAATPRPAPLPAPGLQPQPTPTPGPRPVPTCAPGSFWC